MAYKICPKCKKFVHPGGITGHLRFAHGINKSDELRKMIDAAVLDNSEEILSDDEERDELREKIREIDWEHEHDKLPYSKKEYGVIRRALIMRLEQLDKEFELKHVKLEDEPKPTVSESRPGALKRIMARMDKVFDNKMRAKHGLSVDEKLDGLEGKDEVVLTDLRSERKYVLIGQGIEKPYVETHFVPKEKKKGGKV